MQGTCGQDFSRLSAVPRGLETCSSAGFQVAESLWPPAWWDPHPISRQEREEEWAELPGSPPAAPAGGWPRGRWARGRGWPSWMGPEVLLAGHLPVSGSQKDKGERGAWGVRGATPAPLTRARRG